ncbi:hypothetical protein HO173_009318 [Letharia columbiana]|uniref:Uncharacterized protein n=1 Tax=Letharia columbiana TaxID=112416 RepID=A0A8H6FPQ8_9LECA|nr:uncharacterized protein HO173_009318 [Letharia columbiana]KAF6232439.1 hypothetical protein HO173_009318 [Letharia columbiana]
MLRAKHLPQPHFHHQLSTHRSSKFNDEINGRLTNGRGVFLIVFFPGKKASKGSKIKTTKAKPNGIAKAKRTKPTKARDNRASQYDINLAMSSSSAAAQDDATEAMDYTPADDV